MSRRISLKRLMVGGAAMLVMERRNHHRAMNGEIMASPLEMYRLRVLVVSYVMFAMANRAEEDRPWAIIMKIAPYIPRGELDMAPATSSPMCPTEEYAIRAFRSVWRRQIMEDRTAPQREILINREEVVVEGVGSMDLARKRPYPPSFRRIAARIMDPATGASTWALGSHK